MRLNRISVFAASTGALVITLGGLAGTSAPGTTGAPAAAAQLATVKVYPDIRHVGDVEKAPPTTADCEAAFHVACYEPGQIQRAYNMPPLYRQRVTGKGTTIVIVDSFGSPTIKNDLRTFDQAFRIPAPPSLKIIQPVGRVPRFNPSSADMIGWAGETTLDVEYAHTIAPGASILLVETPVSETEGDTGFPQVVAAENYVIKHHLGDVITQSFGATEQTFPKKKDVDGLRQVYVNAYLHKVTVLASAGDTGATDVESDGATFYEHPATDWPASDPLVTGLGGTQLHLDANGGHRSPDTVWNDTYNAATQQFIYGDNGPNPLATGGGKSVLFPRPPYQSGVRAQTGGGRGVPDVSMSAACDGAVDVYQSIPGTMPGWYPTCGTSEASPEFAGVVALADQVAGHSLGLVNPALYQLAQRREPGIVPVTSGNNTVSFTQDNRLLTVRGASARKGYSTVAGVGTINAQFFVPELAHAAG
jgi:subtilase family serine protease